ncbi:uncharacterized protein [Dysidea avara]|uniref:uncharacterized protein n=1 Tax=Dysidea avara TaxID=196820 RepID=UPI003316B839
MELQKIIANIAAIVQLVVLLGPGIQGQLLTSIPQPSNTYVQVYALPVGQGDCTIIQCPSSGDIIVFDCGSSGANRIPPSYVQTFLGNNINKVRYIFLTHANKDHYNYLYEITTWNNSSVTAVIVGGKKSDYSSANISNWLNNWNTLSKLYMVKNGMSCISGVTNCIITNVRTPTSTISTNFCNNQNIQFNILASNVGSTANQKSIVMKIVHSSWSLLLSGDMEGPAATTIAMALTTTLKSKVYKISHHGASSIANSAQWLGPIKPEQAFASSGYAYGNCRHPTCVTINRILALNTIIAATSHALYCGGNPNMNYPTFQRSIFETSPTSTTICFLTYSSAGSQPGSHCGTPPTLAASTGIIDDDMLYKDDSIDEDDCNIMSGVMEHGGALPMAAFSTLVVIMLLLSFTL